MREDMFGHMPNFGWSLPPGCSTLPGEEPEEPDHVACGKCGASLEGVEPVATPVECWENDEDDVPYLAWADTLYWYTCPSCGEQTEGVPIYGDDDGADVGIA